MNFKYKSLYQFSKDETEYEKMSSKWVSSLEVDGMDCIKIEEKALKVLCKKAFHDISFYFRRTHLDHLVRIVEDPEATANDKYVAGKLIENAIESSKEILPSCQDTGTPIVIGKKGDRTWTNLNDKKIFSEAIFEVYQENNLRFSQMAPLSMFEEKNTQSNLPAQIDLYSTEGNEYHFLFIAKGGGSANKSRLYPMSKSLLREDYLYNFLKKEIQSIGTTACPPYYISVVIGGLSAEENLKIVKLSSTEIMDTLPTTGDEMGRAYRDLEWEEKIFEMTQKIGIGAQFGGKYFAHRVIVIRLPRHGASCPVGIGVSCSAHRNILGKITSEGIFIEKLEKNPQKYVGDILSKINVEKSHSIHLDKPIEVVLKEIKQYPIGTKLVLSGTLIVARDMAHMRLKSMVDNGEAVPEYFKKYPIYYAGPAKTPKGMPTGSFGPTTSNRMDPYLDFFMSQRASMITIGKGGRTEEAKKAIDKYDGVYLGSIGGIAATLSKNHITSIEVIDFEDIGMEAVRKIEVIDFPVIIITNKNQNLY